MTLVQEPVITRNDIKEVHRYEEAIASGRAGDKRWRFLISNLGGIYCSRFIWSPGPRQQGGICGPIKRTADPLDPGDVAMTVDPVLPDDPINPVSVVHGHVQSRMVTDLALETCEGEPLEARVFPETELAMTFFMAFLSEGEEGFHLRAIGLRGESTLLATSRTCR